MHIEKYTTSAVSGLAFHCERGGKEHTNKNIDPEKTKLNMNPKTFEIDGERYAISKSNLNRMKTEHEKNTGRALRKDSPTVCSIVVTLPEQYKNLSQDKKNEFFLTAFWGLYKKFGVKRKSDHASNLLWATVHYDETTPHMHFAFVPWDKKKDKITYKTIVNRDVYRTLHQDLDKYLSEHLEYYKGGILLPPEKQRTRAYNIKDAQKFNEDLENQRKSLDADKKNWDDDKPRRDKIREDVENKESELEKLSGELEELEELKEQKEKLSGELEELKEQKEKLSEELEELKEQKLDMFDNLKIFKFINRLPFQIHNKVWDESQKNTPEAKFFRETYMSGLKFYNQLHKPLEEPQKQQEHSITR